MNDRFLSRILPPCKVKAGEDPFDVIPGIISNLCGVSSPASSRLQGIVRSFWRSLDASARDWSHQSSIGLLERVK